MNLTCSFAGSYAKLSCRLILIPLKKAHFNFFLAPTIFPCIIMLYILIIAISRSLFSLPVVRSVWLPLKWTLLLTNKKNTSLKLQTLELASPDIMGLYQYCLKISKWRLINQAFYKAYCSWNKMLQPWPVRVVNLLIVKLLTILILYKLQP